MHTATGAGGGGGEVTAILSQVRFICDDSSVVCFFKTGKVRSRTAPILKQNQFSV